MPDVKITFEEVRAKATEMRGYNETLTQTLQEIKSTINALEADYTSDTSDTIRSAITAMQPKFDNYKEVIESYAAFLDNVAQRYETTEGTLNTNASSQFMNR